MNFKMLNISPLLLLQHAHVPVLVNSYNTHLTAVYEQTEMIQLSSVTWVARHPKKEKKKQKALNRQLLIQTI